MPDVEAIARGLTKAQKECVIAKRRVSGRLAEWRELMEMRLIDTRPVSSSILTPLGQQVRHHLTEGTDHGQR